MKNILTITIFAILIATPLECMHNIICKHKNDNVIQSHSGNQHILALLLDDTVSDDVFTSYRTRESTVKKFRDFMKHATRGMQRSDIPSHCSECEKTDNFDACYERYEQEEHSINLYLNMALKEFQRSSTVSLRPPTEEDPLLPSAQNCHGVNPLSAFDILQDKVRSYLNSLPYLHKLYIAHKLANLDKFPYTYEISCPESLIDGCGVCGLGLGVCGTAAALLSTLCALIIAVVQLIKLFIYGFDHNNTLADKILLGCTYSVPLLFPGGICLACGILTLCCNQNRIIKKRSQAKAHLCRMLADHIKRSLLCPQKNVAHKNAYDLFFKFK